MKPRCLAGLFALVLAGSASAQMYECTMTERDPRVDWISERMSFVIGNGANASVVDDITRAFNQEPVAAQVWPRAGGVRLTWTVLTLDALQNQAQMSYRADFNSSARTITVRASPVGHPQSWRGMGTCALRGP